MTTVRSSQPGLRFLAWMGLVLAAFFVLFVGGTYAGLADQAIRILTQTLALVVLGVWLVGMAFRPDWRPRGVIPTSTGIAVGGSGLATLLSVNPRLSLEAFLVGAAIAGSFLLLIQLADDRWFRPRLGTLIVAIPFVIASANLAQVGVLWVEWWGYVGRIAMPPLRPADASLTLGGANVLPSYLLLLAPLGAAILHSRRARPALAVALLILSLAAVVISGSRGGLLGVAVAVVVAAALLVTHGASIRNAVRSQRRRIALALVLVAGAGLALVAGPALAGRFLQTSGVDQRLDFWRAAWSIFLQDPIDGGGPGTWAMLKFAVNPEGAPNLVVPHAHNIVLQLLAETGLVGLLSMIPLVVLVAGRIARSTSGTVRLPALEGVAVAAGLAGFFTQNLVDNLLNLPAVGLMLAAVVAWVSSGNAPESESARSATGPPRGTSALRPIWAALAILVVGSAGWFAWHASSAALAAERGRDAVARRDWVAAHDHFNAAAAADPEVPLYLAELAVAGAWSSDADSEILLLRDVVQEDSHPVHLVSLARLELDTGQAFLALDHARRAWRVGSADVNVALNVGAIAEAAGEGAFAREAYLQVLRLHPRLAGATYWQEPEREVSIEALAHELAAQLEAAGDAVGAATVRAWAGDPASSLAVLERLPASTSRDVALADTLDLLHRRPEAVTLLEGTLDRNPLAAPAADWLALAAEAAGDEATASRYRRWAAISGTGAFARPGGLGGEVTHDPFAASPFPANYAWAVYLRHGPIVFVVPGVVAIAPQTLR